MKNPQKKLLSAPKHVLVRRLFAGISIVSLLGLAGGAFAGTAGTVTHLSGTLTVKRDGASKLLAVKSEIQEGDVLATETETYARIKMIDGGEVVMRPGTQLRIDKLVYNEAKPEEDGAVFSLLKGGLRAVTGLIGKRNKERVSFTTPTATIGIRGTNLGALECSNDCGGVQTATGEVPENGLHVDVATGKVAVTTKEGTTVVDAGRTSHTANANSITVVNPPGQGVQVTMPSTIAQNKGEGKGIGVNDTTKCTP